MSHTLHPPPSEMCRLFWIPRPGSWKESAGCVAIHVACLTARTHCLEFSPSHVRWKIIVFKCIQNVYQIFPFRGFLVLSFIPHELKFLVFYRFQCGNCNVAYVGKTVRHLGIRACEQWPNQGGRRPLGSAPKPAEHPSQTPDSVGSGRSPNLRRPPPPHATPLSAILQLELVNAQSSLNLLVHIVRSTRTL